MGSSYGGTLISEEDLLAAITPHGVFVVVVAAAAIAAHRSPRLVWTVVESVGFIVDVGTVRPSSVICAEVIYVG
jgi:hypothetical protein